MAAVGCYEGHEWPILRRLAYVLWLKERREGPERAMAVTVLNGSKANRISNLDPLPTSEYHKDINISGPATIHPPTDFPRRGRLSAKAPYFSA